MIREACIPLEARGEWEEALRGIRHTFAHTWENAYAMYLTTGLETFLYTFASDDVRIVCPLCEREFQGHTDVVTPYGISGFAGNGSSDSFPSQWSRFTLEKGYVCGFLSLHPLLENGTYFAAVEADAYNAIYVLDLSLSQGELFGRLSTSRRREIRSEEGVVDVMRDEDALSRFFLRHYDDFVARKGAATTYRLSEESLSVLVNSGNTFIFGARNSSGEPESVALFAHTETVATYLFGVSLPTVRSRTALLIWKGIMHAQSLGVKWMDLGGGVRPGDSIAEFKRRFGGDMLPLRALKQVYQPDQFESLCRAVDVPPDSGGYFPPYRRR